MAITVATAYVQVVPSLSGVGKAIANAFDSAAENAGKSAGGKAGSGMLSGLSAKAGAIAGAVQSVVGKAVSAVSSSIGSAISRADQMNNFPKVMKNLGYSAEDAGASIRKISSALDGLPTTSSAMAGMVQQLAPLTKSLDEATNISLAFNDAMLAGGASTAEQENALTQYTQMLAAGKVDMAAWRSIQAAMPGQLNQIAEAMLGAGKNGNDLYEAMKDGTVSFDDFNQAVMRLDKQGLGQYASFADQAKAATQGIGTAVENVRNRVAKAMQKVIEAIGTDRIAGAINGISSKFGPMGDAAAKAVTVARKAFDKMGAAVTDLAGKVKQTAGFQAFANAVTNLRDALGDAWGMLRKTASGVMDSVTAMTGSQPVVTAFANAFRFLSDKVADVANGIRLAVQAISLSLEGLSGGTAVDDLASVFDQLRITVNTVKQAVMDFLSGVASSGMWQAIGQVAHTVAQAFDDITWKVWSALDALNTQPGFDWAGLGKQIGDAFGAAIDAVNSVAKAFADMASRNLQPLADAIGNISTAIAGMSVDALGRLADALTRLSDWVDAHSQGVANAITAVGLAFISWKGLDMTIGAVTTALNAFSVACNGLSGGLMAVMGMGTGLKGLGDAIKGAGIATALGGAIGSVKDLGAAISLIPEALGEAGAVIGPKLATIGGAIGGAFSSLAPILSNPVTWIVVAIAAVIAAGVWFFTKTETGRKAWQSFCNAVSTAWNGMLTGIKTLWDNVSGAVSSAWNTFTTTLGTAWNALCNAVTTAWNTVWGVLEPIFAAIGHALYWIGIVVAAGLVTAWHVMCDVVTTVWDTITNAVSAGVQAVSDWFHSWFDPLVTWWQGVWQGISGWFSDRWNDITGIAQTVTTDVSDAIHSVFDAISGWWSGVWDGVSNTFSTIWNAIKSTADNVLNAISDTFHSIFDPIANWWGDVWDGVKNAASNAVQHVADTLSGVKDKVLGAFKGAGDWLRDVGGQIIEGLKRGITDKFDSLKNTVSDTCGKIQDWAEGVLGINSPSRVMRREVGRYVTLGLALGITDEARSVRKATEGVLGQIIAVQAPAIGMPTAGGIGSATPTLATAAAGAGGITLNYQNYAAPGLSAEQQLTDAAQRSKAILLGI